jgi:hypothetical protein
MRGRWGVGRTFEMTAIEAYAFPKLIPSTGREALALLVVEDDDERSMEGIGAT